MEILPSTANLSMLLAEDIVIQSHGSGHIICTYLLCMYQDELPLEYSSLSSQPRLCHQGEGERGGEGREEGRGGREGNHHNKDTVHVHVSQHYLTITYIPCSPLPLLSHMIYHVTHL